MSSTKNMLLSLLPFTSFSPPPCILCFMPFDLTELIGRHGPHLSVSRTKKDWILHDVGIGKVPSDHELLGDYVPIPTFLVVLYLRWLALDLTSSTKEQEVPPALGPQQINPRLTAHVGQAIDIMKQAPLESGPGWSWVTRFVSASVAPDGKGILFTAESLLVHADVEAYAKLRSALCIALALTFPTRKSRAPSQASIFYHWRRPRPHPDYTIADEPLAVQVLLHRLLYDTVPV